MKRWLFVFVLILALLLGACAPESPDVEDPAGDTAETSEGIELRFSYYADGNEAEVMEGLLGSDSI